MQLLSSKSAPTLIADQAFALALPPPTFGDVAHFTNKYGTVPQFDLEIWSNATVGLTNAQLFAGSTHPYEIADVSIDAVDNTTETIMATAHGLLTGDGPVRIASDDTLPAGLSATVDYWVIKVDADTLKLATSLSGAMAGTAVAFTDDGVGNLTLSDTSDTQRVHWTSDGLLGIAEDGAISLTNQVAYRVRRDHRPRALFYALVATLSTSDPEWVSAAVYPIQGA